MLSMLNSPPRERQGTFRGTGVISHPRDAREDILVLQAELDGIKGERDQAIRTAEVVELERDAAVAGRDKAVAAKNAEVIRADLAEKRLRQMGQLWQSFAIPPIHANSNVDGTPQVQAPKTPKKGVRRSLAIKTEENRVAPGTMRRVTRSKAAPLGKKKVEVLVDKAPIAPEKQRAATRARKI